MILSKFSLPSLRWKFRQWYARARAFLGRGIFIYTLPDGRRFAVLSGDLFSETLFVSRGHEAKELEWCRAWLSPGDAVIDCGANIGFWSASLVQQIEGLRVVAIEGNNATAEDLRRVIKRLGLQGITIHEGILSASEDEMLALPSVAGREPWQRATPSNIGGSHAVTLDGIVERYGPIPPALVKIDCEGYEVNILRGATHLLESIRPAFMIECNEPALAGANTSSHELFEVLRQARYTCIYLAAFAGECQPGREVTEPLTATEFNFAAIPAELVGSERWTRSQRVFSHA